MMGGEGSIMADDSGVGQGSKRSVDEDQKPDDSFVISPNIVLAYLANMGTAVFSVVVVLGSLFSIPRIVGEDPFAPLLELIGVSGSFVVKILVSVACVYLIAVFIDTVSTCQDRVRFSGDRIYWFEGKFARKEVSAPISALAKVNYKKSWMGSFGSINLELSGTETDKVSLDFVGDVVALAGKLQGFIATSQNKPAQTTPP
jgi:hypothetical protein